MMGNKARKRQHKEIAEKQRRLNSPYCQCDEHSSRDPLVAIAGRDMYTFNYYWNGIEEKIWYEYNVYYCLKCHKFYDDFPVVAFA